MNFRKGWYANIDSVAVNGDDEVVFNLKRPQRAILSLLASGFTPIYPCHVPPREMRRSPIGRPLPASGERWRLTRGLITARKNRLASADQACG